MDEYTPEDEGRDRAELEGPWEHEYYVSPQDEERSIESRNWDTHEDIIAQWAPILIGAGCMGC